MAQYLRNYAKRKESDQFIMKKRNQIVSHTDFENIKKNIALLEIEGTTKQKNIIRHDDIRKQLNRSFLYRSEARKMAKKLDIDYIILCQMPARSVDNILKEEQKQKFRLSNSTEDDRQKSEKEEMEGKMEKLNNMESAEKAENREAVENTETTENVETIENTENKETAENSAIRKIDIFKKITGKSARYVCTQLGFSPSSLSLLKKGIKLSVVEDKINKTMPFIFEGYSYEDSDPQKIIEMFEKNAEKVRKDQPKKTRKAKQTRQAKRAKTAKTNKNAEMQKKAVKTEKIEKRENTENTERKEKTNLEYYQTRIIETANEFMSNGKMTAARATTNALKSIIPDSADSPEKVLNWLNGKHEDKYFLSDVEEAMLSGYFKMHKNALITVFADTYMYESKVESGLFKGVPANITLEYLRDHSVKKGSEKNG